MTPEQAASRREQALRNAMLGLGRLPSDEISPTSSRAAGILYELQASIQRIEQAEMAGADLRQREAALTEDERVKAAMGQLAAQGFGRI